MVAADHAPARAPVRRRPPMRVARWFRLRRFMPRTLFGRSLLIIALPVLLTQAVTAFYFYRQHWEHMTSRLAFAVAGELAMVIEQIEAVDGRDERRILFEQAARTMELTLTFEEGATLTPRPRVAGHWILQSELEWALNDRVPRPYAITPQVLDRWAEIEVQLDNGVLRALVPRTRLFSATSQIIMVWMVGSGLVLVSIALLFMRNQVRPIRRLAEAADRFGKGRDVPSFRPAGAREVRRAAHAFLVMRDRIRRQINQRTEMLAAVSHDLRTPLTRMKLELAMLPDGPDVAELRDDVNEMEHMISAYLSFARDGSVEETATVDLVFLLEEVISGARRQGAKVTFDAQAPLAIPAKPQALKRCIANLLSNAQRYADRIVVSIDKDSNAARVFVDDDGPGIPEGERKAVLRPFHRVEQSRNVSTGGVGLGLTIARDIARNHGGDLKLRESPLGGLRCVVILPF